MCDIVGGAAKGTCLEWSIMWEEGDNFSLELVHHSTFHCSFGHQVGQIIHFVFWSLLGFPRNLSMFVMSFRWAHCNMAFVWIK